MSFFFHFITFISLFLPFFAVLLDTNHFFSPSFFPFFLLLSFFFTFNLFLPPCDITFTKTPDTNVFFRSIFLIFSPFFRVFLIFSPFFSGFLHFSFRSLSFFFTFLSLRCLFTPLFLPFLFSLFYTPFNSYYLYDSLLLQKTPDTNSLFRIHFLGDKKRLFFHFFSSQYLFTLPFFFTQV